MQLITVAVDPKIFEQYPNTHITCMIAKNVVVKENYASRTILEEFIRSNEQYLKNQEWGPMTSKKDFDCPTLLIHVGNLFCRYVKDIRYDANLLSMGITKDDHSMTFLRTALLRS
ncbi:hypothetical protein HNQ34_000835 [Anoxybacillus tepidamans]|uniref:Uncharacterized protein n=1 Tax=Anoxybacteroides tepidamans TaxID=265948 RepID=A0A7W8MUC4_9BACL|nr:hypothetical protein [Anoxybacillus tepidamans]